METKYARTCHWCHRAIHQGEKHFELALIRSWSGGEDAYEQSGETINYFCSPGCVINFVVSKKVLKEFMGKGPE